MTIRFASFNASLNRFNEGELVQDLSTPDNEQAQNVAEIIQRNNPDVLLINEFDYDPNQAAASLFQENYLSVSQNGAAPVEYPYVYVAPSNTGIPSGFDLDNDGEVGGPGDAFGFGFFPGQFGMALFSKYPIDTENLRTFQNFLWQDMPGALLPDDPATPEPDDWYSAEELEVFRLSSKSHWDVPIEVDGEIIHVLASHPTPPVFDGPEDRNGTRNFDEIRFWADYVQGADYIYDDEGNFGGLQPGARFVVMGDQNSDPFDGDSIPGAIQQLLNNPLVNTSTTPASEGGVDAALRQGEANLTHLSNPAYDTADFSEPPGNLRADYVLPSQNLDITDAGVIWPSSDTVIDDLVVFGDSYSDTGNIAEATLGLFPPSPPYFEGRFSNGPIWVDFLAPWLGLEAEDVFNFATGGATTGREGFVPGGLGFPLEPGLTSLLPGLLDQVDVYTTFAGADGLDSDDLHLLWFNGNELQAIDPTDTEAVQTTITEAVTNIAQAVTTLVGLGAEKIAIANAVDLGTLPLALQTGIAPLGSRATSVFNQALAETIDLLEQQLGLDLLELDASGPSQAFVANAAAFGFANVTDPLLDVADAANAEEFLFLDDIHYTTRAQEFFAREFLEDLALTPTLETVEASSDHRLVYADVDLARAGASQNRVTVDGLELLGEVSFATGTELAGTEIGGLSGIVYDPTLGVYYALADDRSSDARFYTLGIDLSDGSLDEGDVAFRSVTQLRDGEGNPFPDAVLDPEGIALTGIGTLYIASEGDANQLIDPFVRQFSITGQQISELPVPAKYLPTADQASGIRNNLAFESLTLTPDQRFLYTATENALFQDGPPATLEDPSLSRILKYDLSTGEPVAEVVYEVEVVPDAPDPADGFATNGLVELLALDNNGTFLALERGFSVGAGNTVKLYQVNAQGALDVLDASDLIREEAVEVDEEILPPGPFEIDPAVIKTELLDIEADLGIEPDNLEGLALGPVLPDGRQSLIVVSDNNFSDTQKTQFIALALELDTTPAALPVVETPLTVDDEDGNTPLLGDSDDPAIWVNPTDPEQSVVFATLKDGGLVSFDLQGNILETYRPADFGDIRYNNVDLVYGFTGQNLAGEFQTDLAVLSDRANDTLAILAINPETGAITDITSPDIPETIFGVDDGEATAYGLATYTSPVSGKSYAFVTQADGNLVAQLELIPEIGPADEFFVNAEVVRTLELPVPTGDVTDSQSEGLVIDQELGLLYVALETEVGILRFSAEPDGGEDFTLVQPVDADYLVPDIEGLNLYYGPEGSGYLIANSQGDSAYAVFSREATNEYLGSFVVGGSGDIDQVNESDGLDVVNVPLGPGFPNGLLVLQDGANDPQNAVADEEELENNSTNFKFVPWDGVANAFDNPLLVAPSGYNPRNPQPQSLVNGVASGDISQDSVVLWARSTFLGDVTFEYSTRADFAEIAGTTSATVTDINQPVKVDIEELTPGTEYFYRVTDAAGDTETGRFTTAAPLGESTGLNFGIAGDWQQAPPFPILSSAAESNLDFFVKLGDTIYADTETPAIPGVSQAQTLEQFRAKHSEILSPRFGLSAVSDLYQTTSIFATIDDHEVVDNFAGGAAPGESPDAPDIGSSPDPLFTDDVEFVNDTQAYENALQAYQEYHPLQDRFYDTPEDPRTDGERQLYRSQSFGSDAALFMLDSRSFRDAQLPPADLADPTQFLVDAFDPTRTLLGRAQVELLKQDLLAAEENGVTWKFVTIPEPIQNFGVVTAEDRFEGYAAERTEILKFIDDNDIDNVVFMAGDFHGTIVNNLTYQEGPGQEQVATNAFEVVTGPVAFFDGRFGPNVANLSAAAGFIGSEELAFYDSLPVAPDADDALDDKDDFIKQLLITQTDLFGYDPVGLNNNLESAEGLIDATLLQGDYLAAHTYSWTEFDIAPDSQKLTVTTYGIDAYSEADVLADPQAVLSLTPTIISQFEVAPQDLGSGSNPGPSEPPVLPDDSPVRRVGTELDDVLAGLGSDDLIAGLAGDDDLSGDGGDNTIKGQDGDDLISGGPGNDRLKGGDGRDEILGGAGDDAIAGGAGDDLIIGGIGSDALVGGAGADTFIYESVDDGGDMIRRFELGVDTISIQPLLQSTGVAVADMEDAMALGVLMVEVENPRRASVLFDGDGSTGPGEAVNLASVKVLNGVSAALAEASNFVV